jgi:zinc D-Ala-D-Ala carboxypeptidase
MPRHFTDQEVKGLSPLFVEKLDQARDIAGVPFIITSGKRTEAENSAAQGVENSAHLRGLAVDLHCPNSDWRFKIVKGCLQAGFTRIGVYDQHLHVDDDKTLPQSMMWWGKSH